MTNIDPNREAFEKAADEVYDIVGELTGVDIGGEGAERIVKAALSHVAPQIPIITLPLANSMSDLSHGFTIQGPCVIKPADTDWLDKTAAMADAAKVCALTDERASILATKAERHVVKDSQITALRNQVRVYEIALREIQSLSGNFRDGTIFETAQRVLTNAMQLGKE